MLPTCIPIQAAQQHGFEPAGLKSVDLHLDSSLREARKGSPGSQIPDTLKEGPGLGEGFCTK